MGGSIFKLLMAQVGLVESCCSAEVRLTVNPGLRIEVYSFECEITIGFGRYMVGEIRDMGERHCYRIGWIVDVIYRDEMGLGRRRQRFVSLPS